MRRILAVLLSVLLLAGLVPASLADGGVATAVAKAQFNLRTEPDAAAKFTINVPLGTEMDVLEYGEDWCRVQIRSYTGYARRSWLRLTSEVDESAVPAAQATSAPAARTEDAQTAATVTDLASPTDAAVFPAVGLSATGAIAYDCMTRVKFSIRKEADESSFRLYEIGKGKHLSVLAYGTDWCQVQTTDGGNTGYAKTKWLFHFHSNNPFLYPMPDYDQYRMNGYLVLTKDEHITDEKNLYGGNDLKAGDIIFVQGSSAETARILLRRTFTSIPAASATYHALTPWREAREGDVVGGYTQFFGQKQGGIYFMYRKKNMQVAAEKMDGTVIRSGEEYSFLTDVGPVTRSGGYTVAGITGGEGSGIGGGICHTSTLMYQAALSLPFLITEREPHTDDGTHYAPLEFDATVGVYSDFRFVNTLPYAVRMDVFFDMQAGVVTVQFVCLETVSADVLASWDGSAVMQAAN